MESRGRLSPEVGNGCPGQWQLASKGPESHVCHWDTSARSLPSAANTAARADVLLVPLIIGLPGVLFHRIV